MNPIGYCLWCGSEIHIEAVSIGLKELDWSRCIAPYPCLGGIFRVVTDYQGFVIHPHHKRGRYIYTRLPNEDLQIR